MKEKELDTGERASSTTFREGPEGGGGWGSGDPEETSPWERVRPREVSGAQWQRFEDSFAEMFEAFGMDLETAGTEHTPQRFVRALFEATSGYEGDPKLLTAFPTECGGGPDCSISQVIEGPIPFFALCEHHAFPFYGVAHVGYVAHEQIIGISKLTRLVRVYARRFTVQERIGQQVADHLNEMLQPHGVAVHLQAAHLCTQMRGVREERSRTSTSFWRGNYERDPDGGWAEADGLDASSRRRGRTLPDDRAEADRRRLRPPSVVRRCEPP